jgi:hypothetical protein
MLACAAMSWNFVKADPQYYVPLLLFDFFSFYIQTLVTIITTITINLKNVSIIISLIAIITIMRTITLIKFKLKQEWLKQKKETQMKSVILGLKKTCF